MIHEGVRGDDPRDGDEDSPWYVVPADNKWFTRVIVAAAMIDAMSSLKFSYPVESDAKREELAERGSC